MRAGCCEPFFSVLPAYATEEAQAQHLFGDHDRRTEADASSAKDDMVVLFVLGPHGNHETIFV